MNAAQGCTNTGEKMDIKRVIQELEQANHEAVRVDEATRKMEAEAKAAVKRGEERE